MLPSCTWKHIDGVSLVISDCWQHGDSGEIFVQSVCDYFDGAEIIVLGLEPDVMGRQVPGQEDHVQVRLGVLVTHLSRSQCR